MSQYVHHANEVLRAAGIEHGSTAAAELLRTLADSARDWADRAVALGGEMEPLAATRVAAQALNSDQALHQRLEILERGAADLLAKIHSVVTEIDASPLPVSPALRLRRWGGEAQPNGRLDENRDVEPATVAVSSLIGLSVLGEDGVVVGVVQSLQRGVYGDCITSLTLAGRI